MRGAQGGSLVCGGGRDAQGPISVVGWDDSSLGIVRHILFLCPVLVADHVELGDGRMWTPEVGIVCP